MTEPAPAPTALLARPPEEGARLLALHFLDQAAAARPRLDDSSDAEALHDFRVALRRLRSCLRAYWPYLEDSVPGKLSTRLRRLAGATGAGRDAEVQIAWLREREGHLGAYHRAGWAWLLARLEARRRSAYEEVLAQVAEEFGDLETALRRRLSVYRAEVRLDRPEPRATLGAATAEVLRHQVADLEERLSTIGSAEDDAEAHAARIAAKRLRYLLEPLHEELPAGKPPVRRLKALQDLLGELHDAHVLESELAEAVEAAAAERARALLDLSLAAVPDDKLLRAERRRARESGLIALARLNRARRDRLFEILDDDWLDSRAHPFLREVESLGETLAAAPPDTEAELPAVH